MQLCVSLSLPPFLSPGCARRVKRCFDCRAQITVKEGLRKFNVLLAIPGDLAVFSFFFQPWRLVVVGVLGLVVLTVPFV